MIAITHKSKRAMRRLRRRVAAALRSRGDRDAPAWIASHVRMSDDFEVRRGPYDLDGRPWWRGVLEAAADPVTRNIRLMASPQVGKTLVLCALLCYLAENAPASAMVILPDRDAAIEFRDRLYSLADESGIKIPQPYRWNTRHCDIGKMRVYLAWPKSRQRLRGRRCKYVFRSEVDVWESIARVGDPIEASNQRVKAFPRHLILDESSPVPAPSTIDELEHASRQHRWTCPCPHCGRWQKVRFFTDKKTKRGGVAGIRDREGRYVEPGAARKRAYYSCEHGGCKITSTEKHAFMCSGRWVAEGQSIDAAGTLRGKPLRDARDMGFHLWAAHSAASWGQIAYEWCTARINGTVPDCFQNTFGLSFKERATMPTWEQLGRKNAGTHARGTVHRAAWFLTAGADVQEREVFCSLRAWGDQRTSWLVDWYVFERDDDEGDMIKHDLEQLDAVLDRYYAVEGGSNPRGETRLRCVLMCVDANYRTLDVHNWIRSRVAKHGARARVRACRGDAQVKPSERYKMSTLQNSRRDPTVVYDGGLELWGINPEVFRSDLAQRFQANPTKPGAWLVTAGCIDEGKHFLQQLVNEPRVIEKGKDGRPRAVYRERERSVGHDFWDTAVYESAAAQMVVDQMPNAPGWDATGWPKKRKSKATSTQRAPTGQVQREF